MGIDSALRSSGRLRLRARLAAATVAVAAMTGGAVIALAGSASAATTLRGAAEADGRYFGVAVGQGDLSNTSATNLAGSQFDMVTPENEMKWDTIEPSNGSYNFGPGDNIVNFATSHNERVRGHNLVWHSQTGAWVFQGPEGKPADRETLLARMRDHIQTVVGRYKGRIHGWDVVNEAIDEDGSLRKTPWRDGIGDDYVAKAFEFAREADPNAELYYNDYNLEKPEKRAGVIKLVNDLKARGLRIDGIGNQAHWRLETPTMDAIEQALVDLNSTGLKVMYTELDINLLPSAGRGVDPAVANPYANGLPDEKQQQLARRYADIFGLIVKHRTRVSRVTFWGLSDADSWLNRGRMNHPLLWDRQRQPKPAFHAVVDVLKRAR